MLSTVRTEGPASHADLAHLEERARLALEPFRPRVARATLRVRRTGPEEVAVELSVPLGAAGTVRVRCSGPAVRACGETVIRRAAEVIGRRLRTERQELLEFLLLAGGDAGGWAAPGHGPRRRGAAKAGRDGSRKHRAPRGRGTKAAA